MPLNISKEEESFANPQPPPNYRQDAKEDSSGQPMTNADFRKLLMTPAAGSHKPEASLKNDIATLKNKKSVNDAAEKRREKKLYYASLMKEVKEREEELSKKYRDRAKERRDVTKDSDDFISTTANFKAVAPDAKLGDNAEIRKRIIEESKYLGGDIQHTHLVKGLDYSLLQKVKAEIEKLQESNEAGNDLDVDEEEEEKPTETSKVKMKIDSKKTQPPAIPKAKVEKEVAVDEDDETKIVFKTKMARNIYRVVFESKPPKINELFLPRRMAYVVDLDDNETDIPVTLTRSKADCPNLEVNSTMTTNDIVINKLTQILSYLRQGGKKDAKKLNKLNKKGNTDEDSYKQDLGVGLGIYDDVGDYIPDTSKKARASDISKKDDPSKSKTYFSNDKRSIESTKEFDKEKGPTKETAEAFIKNIIEKNTNKTAPKKEEKKVSNGMAVKFDSDSYAECYPGTRAEEDVNIDSDDEPDYDKMDLGSKKGPVGRWDFDTTEQYSDYMSQKEALPKAAFQYGKKMNDGRKTRRAAGDTTKEKAKIEKEWHQISKIIDKRKTGDYQGSEYKKPKY